MDGGWETNGQRGCDNRFLHLYSHMRVSVPGIPQAILDASPVLALKSIPEAIQRLTEFIGAGNVALVTGAGVSVDSGIRAYRGEDGRYMNPNYKYNPFPPRFLCANMMYKDLSSFTN